MEFADSRDLRGARVWLSASIPAQGEASDDERAAIREFVIVFCREVFLRGGHIVHGGHPDITPLVAREAQRVVEAGGRRDILLLAASRHFSQAQRAFLADFRQVAVIEETPAATGDNALERSLQNLREWIRARADVFVSVGGLGKDLPEGAAGVPVELSMAMERHLPCFIAAGFGGAVRKYLDARPAILQSLHNGLSEEQNRDVAYSANVAGVATQVVRQMARLPLVRGNAGAGATFRVLALDGGGIRGAFSAAVLSAWEHQTGHRIVDHFDLIVGTSTGGILALGLGAGLEPKDMLELYRRRGVDIFPMTTLGQRLRRKILQIFRSKFGSAELRSALTEAYNRGGVVRTLADSPCRLMIPTFHAVDGKPFLFRTPHVGSVRGQPDTALVEVALATSAAPTYFAAAGVQGPIAQSWYFDGGVWANAPVLAAVVEAVSVLGVPLERVDVLSVGTTNEVAFFGHRKKSGGLGWIRSLVRLFMNAQEGAALALTRRLIGNERFFRVDSTAVVGRYSLDDPRYIEELADKGQFIAVSDEVLPVVQQRFLNGLHVVPWNPQPPGAEKR